YVVSTTRPLAGASPCDDPERLGGGMSVRESIWCRSSRLIRRRYNEDLQPVRYEKVGVTREPTMRPANGGGVAMTRRNWTGGDAQALRLAMELGIEEFAARLSVAP